MKFAYNNLNINASPGCGECRGEHCYKDSSKKCLLPLSPPKRINYSGFVQISNYKNCEIFSLKHH